MRKLVLLFVITFFSGIAFGQAEFIQKAEAQYAQADFGVDQNMTITFENAPTEGSVIVALFGGRSGSDDTVTPVDADAGWISLGYIGPRARFWAFYKFVGPDDDAVEHVFYFNNTSNYFGTLLEYSNVSMVSADFFGVDADLNEYTFGPVDAIEGQIAIAGFSGRALSDNESIAWDTPFELINSPGIGPVNPVSGSTAHYLVEEDGPISARATWTGSAQPAGVIVLLTPSLPPAEFIQKAEAQYAQADFGVDQNLTITFENAPTEGSVIVALFGGRAGTDNTITPVDADAGWISLGYIGPRARFWAFYKFVGPDDDAVEHVFYFNNTSNYFGTLLEYSNVSMVSAEFFGVDADLNEYTFGPVDAIEGQIAIAGFSGRALSDNESIAWDTPFELINSPGIGPINPVSGSTAHYFVGEDGPISARATWTGTAQPAGILVLLMPRGGPVEVSFEVIGENGLLVTTVDGEEIESGDLVERGKHVLFTAFPSPDYTVKEWKMDGEVIEDHLDNELLKVILDPVTVTVEFRPLEDFMVSFDVVGENGTLTAAVDSIPITTGDVLQEGSEVVFTATPAEGYRVKEWKLNDAVVDGLTDNEYTVEWLNMEIEVTVEFEIADYVVNFNVIGENGTLTATADGDPITTGDLVLEDSEVVFTATPALGYRVKEWRSNLVLVPFLKDNEYTVAALDAEITVTVEFEAITHVVNFSVDGDNGTLAATVDDGPINSGNLVQQGSDVVFTATPDAGYQVKEWKLDNVVVEDLVDDEFTLEALDAEATVTVEFEVVTSASRINLNENLSIYPNPFGDNITVTTDTNIDRIVINNTVGQLVISKTGIQLNEIVIGAEELDSGIYFITIVSGDRAITKKIIKY